MRLFGMPALFVLLAWPLAATAGFRPSFFSDQVAWNASHVVVATEGDKIDGVLKVLESWTGDLAVGAEIRIPELEAFADPDKRQLRSHWRRKDDPERVTGQRMVLFLRRTPLPPRDPSQPGIKPPPVRDWHPATHWGAESFTVSVVWVEGGVVFGYRQMMNPGDSVLVRLDPSEFHRRWKDRRASTPIPPERGEVLLKAQARETAAERARFDQVVAIADPALRAEALHEAIVDPDRLEERHRLIDELPKCGPLVVPHLRKLLFRPELTWFSNSLTSAAYSLGPEVAGPALKEWLAEELPFWRAFVPIAKEGWQKQEATEGIPQVASVPVQHAARTASLLHILEGLTYAYHGAAAEARELRPLLARLPATGTDAYNSDWRLMQLEKCDRLLELEPAEWRFVPSERTACHVFGNHEFIVRFDPEGRVLPASDSAKPIGGGQGGAKGPWAPFVDVLLERCRFEFRSGMLVPGRAQLAGPHHRFEFVPDVDGVVTRFADHRFKPDGPLVLQPAGALLGLAPSPRFALEASGELHLAESEPPSVRGDEVRRAARTQALRAAAEGAVLLLLRQGCDTHRFPGRAGQLPLRCGNAMAEGTPNTAALPGAHRPGTRETSRL